MTLVCYAAAGKRKAAAICGAFALGAGGGMVIPDDGPRLPSSTSEFVFGSSPANFKLLDRMQKNPPRSAWYYGDGAYGFGRGEFFRITRNALQIDGVRGLGDSARWHRFGLEIAPWRRAGRAIVVATQSDIWHRWATGYSAEAWAAAIVDALDEHTDREIKVCSFKGGADFTEALHSAWAVVVHSSSAAIAAQLAGVPTFCVAECAASPMSLCDLARVETPYYPEDRAPWLWRLASSQWTLEEIRAGEAWKVLHR